MFTLQILDRGQTLLFPLDTRPVRFGRGPEAEVVLGEEGVADVHARFVPHAGGVRLETSAATSVNGRAVANAVELSLGDRIEIGRAVVVVGRTVVRAATAEDVLATPVRRSAPVVTPPSGRRRSLLPIVAPLGLLGVVVWFAMQPGDGNEVKGELAKVARLRLAGQLPEAQQAVDRLRTAWAAATDDRLARLGTEEVAIRAVEAAFARLLAAVVDPADARNYAAWSQELKRLENDGAADERVAARMVRSDLRATLERRPRPQPIELAGAPDTPTNPTTTAVATAEPTAPSAATTTTTPAPAAATSPGSAELTEARRLRDQGMYAHALELLREASAAAGSTAATQPEMEAVLQRARVDQAELVAAARAAIAAGRAADAQATLQGARPRFPATAEFAELAAALLDAERAVAAAARPAPGPAGVAPVDESVRMASLAAVRAEMDAVRTAESSGDFAAAAARLEAAATSLRSRDPEFAGRLQVRADEARLFAGWHAAVAAAVQNGSRPRASTVEGEPCELRAVTGHRLVAAVGGVERELSWPEVSAAGIHAIADQAAVGGRGVLGAAAMLYKLGENALAEDLLAKALRGEAGLKEDVDRIIARGRGEPFDGRGYTLAKGGFESVRALDVQKSAQQLGARIEAALRAKDRAARDELVGEVLASGAEGTAVLTAALQREFDKQVARLESSTLKKQLEKLVLLRTELDQARKHAKDLIYDEVRYFYPYKPPAVTSDRYAEYLRTQAEVERRTEVVRGLWDDEKVKVRVPATLRADLERLDWVAEVLSRFGVLDPAMLARVEWARALPGSDSVGIRDFCASLAERDELEQWRRVASYNTLAAKRLSAAQRELLRITNDYRALFRHRPLAAVASIGAAAQGHAEEMSRLGYFAHMSPTPGRRTPFDRMQLAGYKTGASENIALVDGPQQAHNAWLTSSGHHRNLLDPNHTEIGIGAEGRNWVQNFGGGAAYRDDPEWVEAARQR